MQKLILVNAIRIRAKLKNAMLILMSPLLGRTRDEIREQQLKFANSSAAQLISSTGEMPGLTPAATSKNEYNRFSKKPIQGSSPLQNLKSNSIKRQVF
jgi:hypothetical protein